MGNGKWEPDPREVECTGGMGTTGPTTLGIIYMYHSIYSIKCHDYSPSFINMILFVLFQQLCVTIHSMYSI
jgi:hypothetical protein